MKGRPQWLDRKMCFYFWMELGTIPRVCSRLYLEGVKNPTTGKAPSNIGVRISAWKWALYHPEEAREMFIKYTGFYTDEQLIYWFEKLDRIAKSFLLTRIERYEEWKKDFDKYVREMIFDTM